MPKVFLTDAQKLDYRYERLRKCIGKRVEWAMSDRRLTQQALANEMHMGHETIRKITDGEEVRLNITDFLKFLDLAGLKLVDRTKDEIAKEGKA